MERNKITIFASLHLKVASLILEGKIVIGWHTIPKQNLSHKTLDWFQQLLFCSPSWICFSLSSNKLWRTLAIFTGGLNQVFVNHTSPLATNLGSFGSHICGDSCKVAVPRASQRVNWRPVKLGGPVHLQMSRQKSRTIRTILVECLVFPHVLFTNSRFPHGPG